MASLRNVCFAVGMVASATAAVVPSSPAYSLKGGASGLEQDGDYIENKIARGVQGGTGKVFNIFGSAAHTAAEEVQSAARSTRDAANRASRYTRDSARNVRDNAQDATKNARDNARQHVSSTKFDEVDEARSRLPWQGSGSGSASGNVGGSGGWGSGNHRSPREVIRDERNAVSRFFSNPNNAFVAQAVVALTWGGLHLLQYDEFIGKVAEPLCKVFGVQWAGGMIGPHIKLVGAYLAGVFISDILAYTSNSAGFKRGKIWHEAASCISVASVCIMQLVTEDSSDLVPHTIAAVIFAAWYSYLSQDY